MIKPNSFLRAVLLPALTGLVVGLLFLCGSREFVSHKIDEWLHDNPAGLFIFGIYLVVLGIVGVAGFFTDIEKLKTHVRKLSIINWYSKVGGLFSGLVFAALLQGTLNEIVQLSIGAALLFASAWVVWYFEKLVFAELPDDNKKKLTAGLASASSVLIGIYALYLASHGGPL